MGNGNLVSENGNKGFSLIELIIVVAIMAVLIAVLAPIYLRYVEKSKQGKDYEVAGVVQHAVTVAMSDTSIQDRPSVFGPASLDLIDNGSMPVFAAAVKEYIGTSSLNTFASDNICSNMYRGSDIMLEIDAASEKVLVTVSANSPGADDIVIE